MMLSEPGRIKALAGDGKATHADAGQLLGDVRWPVLVVQGSADPMGRTADRG